jgi:DNA-binding response OmpR family regulator
MNEVSEAMNLDGAKLLIADCHEDTLILLQKVLEDAGFDTTAVWTAEEFLSAIGAQTFDLVLVNEYIPGGRCDELLHKVQDAQLRCILMLPRNLTATEVRSLESLRSFEVVEKRDYEEIVRRVRKMLDREESAA